MQRIMAIMLSIVVFFSIIFQPISVLGVDDISDENISEEDIFDLGIEGSKPLYVEIPDGESSIKEDLGLIDGIVANISSISTWSLKNNYNDSVEVNIDVSNIISDGDLDVLHFLEDPYKISDDTVILNISNYSEDSKSILYPAMMAYQDRFESDEECVAVEIFEDLEIVNNIISFETESFSIFAVGDIVLNTFEFYVDTELVNKQYIIGDSSGKGVLLEPAVPNKEGSQFLGWKLENSDEYVVFGEITVNMVENTVLRYYADFKDVQYIIFMYEAKEDAYILETLSGEAGETISTEDIDYPLNLDKHIISWHTDVNLTSEAVKSVTFLDGEDIILYPNVLEGHWITFYTDGGSYMEPMFYADDETVISPMNPTKKGYNFSGWVDENGDSFVFENQLLDESLVLTAVWTPANTTYYVQIMFERQNDNGKYDAATGGSFTKTAPTGSVVNGNLSTESERNNCISGIDAESTFRANLTHYEYNATKSANSTAVVLGDGTSIVYVYYDLKYYTVTFNLGNSTSKRMTIGGKTYTGGSTAERYTITAKYGDLIADKWPLAEHFEANDNFRRWQYKTNYYWVTKQHYMIGSDLINKTMIADYTTSSSIIAWYLVESLDQTSPEGGSFAGKDFRKLYNGVYYDMDPVYTQEVKSTVSKWSTQKPIAGYNIVEMVKDSDNDCVYMYYSRTKHNLNFYSNGVNLLSEQDVLYGTPLNIISSVKPYINGLIPPLPSEYKAGTYGFAGWYNTEQCYDGTDVDLSTLSIPNQDLNLYAKWVPINVELYVHVTIDGSDTIIEGYNGFTVKYGNKVDRDKVDSLLDAVEMPEGAIWYGWYEKIDIGDEIDVLVPFNFNRELIEDLVLYPFYSYLEPVHLEYDLNGGTGIVPVDDYSYALGKGAIVLAGEGVIPPDGKVFIGWNTKSDGSGKTYYAGDVAIIDINELKLYAMYGEEPKIGNVNLQYVNTITSEVVSNEYSEYSEIIISDTSIFKEYTSKRYIFKFWNTKSDGSGETFNIGDDIILTSDSENILYAIYEETDLPILNLPISKVLRYYNGLESFKFEFLALLTNENGEVVNNGKEFNGFIIVSDSSLTNGYIEIVYDELELVNGNKFYYKVYEIEDTLNPIFYDTSYYLIEIEIVSDIPTLMNIKKFDNNGIEYSMYAENYLSFVNIYGLDSDALPDTGGSGKNNYKMVSFSISLLGLIVLFIRKKID